MDIAEFTLASAALAQEGALDSEVIFYAAGSAVPTANDYSHAIDMADSAQLVMFLPHAGCTDIVNVDNAYSSYCVVIMASVDGNASGNQIGLELRLSRALGVGTYDIDAPGYAGSWVYVGVCSDDLASTITCANSNHDQEGTVTIEEFGLNPGDHIRGTLDTKLKGGASDFGYLYGRYTASFDFVIPAD